MADENQVKYHINPDTGRPNKCTASIQDCKYAKDGQPPEHYDTKEEARAAYEKQNENQTVKSLKKGMDYPEPVFYDVNSENDYENLTRKDKAAYRKYYDEYERNDGQYDPHNMIMNSIKINNLNPDNRRRFDKLDNNHKMRTLELLHKSYTMDEAIIQLRKEDDELAESNTGNNYNVDFAYDEAKNEFNSLSNLDKRKYEVYSMDNKYAGFSDPHTVVMNNIISSNLNDNDVRVLDGLENIYGERTYEHLRADKDLTVNNAVSNAMYEYHVKWNNSFKESSISGVKNTTKSKVAKQAADNAEYDALSADDKKLYNDYMKFNQGFSNPHDVTMNQIVRDKLNNSDGFALDNMEAIHRERAYEHLRANKNFTVDDAIDNTMYEYHVKWNDDFKESKISGNRNGVSETFKNSGDSSISNNTASNNVNNSNNTNAVKNNSTKKISNANSDAKKSTASKNKSSGTGSRLSFNNIYEKNDYDDLSVANKKKYREYSRKYENYSHRHDVVMTAIIRDSLSDTDRSAIDSLSTADRDDAYDLVRDGLSVNEAINIILENK